MKTITTFTLLILAVISAVAQDGEHISRIGTGGVSGNYLDVKVYSDDVAYYTNRYGLVVMDVSDPEHPHPSRIISTRGNAQGLFLKDSLLFLCDGYEGLRIYDVNDDPWNPREISHTIGPTNARGLVVVDNYAYLWQSQNSVGFIYDISDPVHPEELSRTDFEGGDNMQIHPYGDRCYVVSANAPTYYWNITDRTNPELIGEVNGTLSSSEHNTRFYNGFTKVISHRIVYEVSDSLHMDSIGYLSNFGVSSKKIVNEILFGTGSPDSQGDRNPGMAIVDLTNPRQPRRISWLWGTRRGGIRAISRFFDLSRGRMFTCDGMNGTTIFDVSNVEHPTSLGYYDNRGDFTTVCVSPDFIYTANELNWKTTGYNSFRLRTYSRRPIAFPEEVSALEVGREDSILIGGANALERPMVIGDRLYGITNSHFTGFTLEDPARPRPLFSTNFDPFGAISDYVVDGNMAFGVSTYVHAIDFSDINNPRLLSRFRCKWAQGGIACDEHYLYVHSWNRGLYIYNRDNERRIEQVGFLQMGTTNAAWDILLYGDRAYLNTGHTITIVNIADRQNPSVSGEIIPQGGSTWRTSLSNDVMFVCCQLGGVYAYSLEDPDNPQQIGFYDTPAYASQAVEQDGYLYVADFDEIGVYDVGEITGWFNVTLAEEEHDFGDVPLGNTWYWNLSIANNGRRDVTFRSIELSGDTSAFHCSIDSALTLAPGESIGIPVAFSPLSDTTCVATLSLIDGNGRSVDVALTGRGIPPDGIGTESGALPIQFDVLPPYPNPFNGQLTITVGLDKSAPTRLRVYGLDGREVADLSNSVIPAKAGIQSTVWDASAVPAGLYIVRLESAGRVTARKVVLVR